MKPSRRRPAPSAGRPGAAPATHRPVAPRWTVPAVAALIVLAALVAYHNTFRVPFLFDDIESIVENTRIRSLLTAWSTPPDDGSTVSGRPLVQLTLALNFAVHGLDVTGYHATNLALHAAAALLLFGLVRRTLELPVFAPEWRDRAVPVGAAAALTWVVHPLATAAVTYVVQRAELLAALFLLLMLHALARSATSARPGRWRALAVVACALGMASKEVMASAPLLALLYDRTFIAGTFRAAWNRNRGSYLALAATWLILAGSVLSSGSRGGTVGFGGEVSSWSYALTQCRAIVLYLRLCVWPHPLVFDRGTEVVAGATSVLPQAATVMLLLAATAWALRRRPAPGFPAACFFAVLAPSSSVFPVVTQTVAEHRMYLPLAAVLTLAAAGLSALLSRQRAAFALVAVLAATLLTAATVRRHADYRTAEILWRDTLAKYPQNPRAYVSLGDELLARGRATEALALFEEAVRLAPGHAKAHGAAGNALLALGRPGEAVAGFEAAHRLAPGDGRNLSNLGNALLAAGRVDEAVARQREAVALAPHAPELRRNLAIALTRAGRAAAAVEELRAARRIDPASTSLQLTLANTLVLAGQPEAAILEFRGLLQRAPDLIEAWSNLGFLLAASGRTGEALQCYEELLRRQPGHAEARAMLTRLRSAPTVTPTRRGPP